MIRVAVAGAAGRMGQTLIRLIAETDGVTLTHAIERIGSDNIGRDSGELSAIGQNGILITDSIDAANFDTLIDFTSPNSTLANACFCSENGKHMVIGTTGLTESDRLQLEEYSSSTSIVFAPNMSVGVNLTFKLLEMASKALGTNIDVEVIESHHKHKVDSPSGTALKMGEVVANARGQSLNEVGVFTRHGQIGPRPDGSIGFATIRAGDIVGEHTVMFASEGERIEITHKSSSRNNYAAGAIRATFWLKEKNSGLYSMYDVLGL